MIIPTSLTFDLPDTFKGPPGPAANVEVIEWSPFIGGEVSETGQAYRYQTGHSTKIGRMVWWWSYTQFMNVGTIVGDLRVKGFPFPTALVPGFFSGDVSYSTNLSPTAADITAIDVWTSGGQSKWNLFGRRLGQNPRPLTVADLNNATQLMCHGSYYID